MDDRDLAAAENRPEVVENLRQLRGISRFNSAMIQGGNQLATLWEEEKPGPPRPRRKRRWTPLLAALGIALAAVILFLLAIRPG